MPRFAQVATSLLTLTSPLILAQSPASSSVASPAPVSGSITSTTGVSASSTPSTTTSRGTNGTSGGSTGSTSGPPDVYLNVPELHVGRIELDVENLQADLNLNAKVAKLVTINAGVSVSVQKVNITIADVDAELELIVRLGHLVDIVNRTFESLDLNPLLINTLNNVTGLLDDVVGAVDGLLGSVTQGGTTLSFLIDNLGNIVQQVPGSAGNAVSTIVGDYLTNMTFTGQQQDLGNGLIQKTFSYTPLNALVNIVFNAAGQVVQAAKATAGGSGGGSSSSSGAAPTATPKMKI